MDRRELYKQKAEAQMNEFSATLDVLKARADKLSAQSKLDMQPRMDAVNSKFEAAKAKFAKFADAADDKLDEVCKDIDDSWKDFKAAVEGTFDAFKSHTSS